MLMGLEPGLGLRVESGSSVLGPEQRHVAQRVPTPDRIAEPLKSTYYV